MSKKAKVFVGVSGGVDSSVALALLKNEGYDVTGVFLKVWHPDWMPCDWKEERRSAMRVCATLGVPFITLDCEDEYKKEVVDYMIREYSSGRVPNPDVFCNKYVKFGVFLQKALEMGANFVATGHYALRYEYKNNNDLKINTSKYELRESNDKEKDQSYFVHTLNQDQLKHVLFPIGHLKKSEVRELARKFGLPTADKKDSQGLCFIGKVDMKEFLSHYIDVKPGDVLNRDGDVIGSHDGVMFYTIGQRHGFTISKKSTNDPRYFVVKKDINNNTITVSDKEHVIEDAGVLKVFVSDMSWVLNEVLGQMEYRIRYRQSRSKCEVQKHERGYVILLEKAEEFVPVGQSIVLYKNESCLGGGIIEKTL